MFAPQKDSHGWDWMVHDSGWALGSDWGLERGIVRMSEEGVKQWQLRMRKRRRKEEKVKAIPVTHFLLVLRMLPLDLEVLEIHIVQSGPEGKRLETNPTGQESGPCAPLPV